MLTDVDDVDLPTHKVERFSQIIQSSITLQQSTSDSTQYFTIIIGD